MKYELIYYYDNGKLSAVIKYKNEDIKGSKTKTKPIDEKTFLNLLKELKNSNKKDHGIKNICFDKNDLVFFVDESKVRLHDISLFKKDKRFNFIFEVIKNKKYKTNKQNNLLFKTGVVTMAFLVTISGVQVVKALNKKEDIVQDEIPTTTVNLQVDLANQNYEKLLEEQKNVLKEEVKEEVSTTNIDNETATKAFANKNVSDKQGYLSDSSKAVKTRNLYKDIIEKYANMYGLDSDLMCALATQERGVHNNEIDSGGAIGLMQIQVNVWNGNDLVVYNNSLKSNETIRITTDKLKNVDFNIKTGCAIFKDCLKQMKGNYVAAVQCYNMGQGTMRKILNNYSYATGKTVDEILGDPSDLGWLNYVNRSYAGDPNYVKNVFRYYNGDEFNAPEIIESKTK